MKSYFLLFFLFFTLLAQAEMVDTFQFNNDTDRVRAIALARTLRCPQCQNQNLVESNATQAYTLRLEVYEMVNQGKSDEEIIHSMVQRFGHFIYYKPPLNQKTWVLWGVPIILFLIILGGIFWQVLRNKNNNA
ncbi:respiratory nitrite reductase-specific cytochrome c biogenesis protein NrfF [Bisgaardia hudsonensis]|uniref:Formate-dependent nitrite reductase complex subunit n=1 Tax=Bisgaardia hudsonensis TaxID=109472 RepID=A0A4R2N0H7_9PAST|nr:heme lyase NrfEFG subunit NrfF [Bisgaardia hudsonensis]QLB13478.1 cytochrome C biosynthesis protein [Bisgaardia hudsonensis]TCP12887.1 respiratory nitrite reductase-specific cytochrome c biogenesis protein NrfF [Bisgaardia hudsonensis]